MKTFYGLVLGIVLTASGGMSWAQETTSAPVVVAQPTAPPQGPVRVSGGVMAGMILKSAPGMKMGPGDKM